MALSAEFDSRTDRIAYAVVSAGAAALSYDHARAFFLPFMGAVGAAVTPLLLDAVVFWLATACIRQARQGRPLPMLRTGAYVLLSLSVTANALGGATWPERVFLALPAALFGYLTEVQIRLALYEHRAARGEHGRLGLLLWLRHPVRSLRAKLWQARQYAPAFDAASAERDRLAAARDAVRLAMPGRSREIRRARNGVLRELNAGRLAPAAAVAASGLLTRPGVPELHRAALAAALGHRPPAPDTNPDNRAPRTPDTTADTRGRTPRPQSTGCATATPACPRRTSPPGSASPTAPSGGTSPPGKAPRRPSRRNHPEPASDGRNTRHVSRPRTRPATAGHPARLGRRPAPERRSRGPRHVDPHPAPGARSRRRRLRRAARQSHHRPGRRRRQRAHERHDRRGCRPGRPARPRPPGRRMARPARRHCRAPPPGHPPGTEVPRRGRRHRQVGGRALRPRGRLPRHPHPEVRRPAGAALAARRGPRDRRAAPLGAGHGRPPGARRHRAARRRRDLP